MEAGREAQQGGDLFSISDLLVDARAFVLEQQGVFEALAIAVPLSGETGDRVSDVRSLFRQALEALEGIERSVADGNVARLTHEVSRVESTVSELLPALGALDEAERAVERQSPLPMVNRFIRMAANVREGKLAPDILKEHFGGVLHSVRNLAQNHKRFRALHEAPAALLEAWDREFDRLETGCGAVLEYVNTGADEALIDALKLLKFSSRALVDLLGQMDDVARRDVRWSRLLALDELLRAVEGHREGRIDAEVVLLAAGTLQNLGGYYASALDTVPAFPLAFMVRAECDTLRVEMEALQNVALPWFERLRADTRRAVFEGDTIEAVRARFEATSAAHQRLQDALAANIEALKGAPNLQEIVDALGRLPGGSVPVQYAIDRVQHFLDMHVDLIGQADATGNPDLGEMRALLSEQAAAVEEMARYLEEPEEAHLRNGFMRLCAIHPRMMEMQAEIRSSADAQKRARERTVSCFRCGASNSASSRMCASCNAMLPMAQADDTVYDDIGGSGQSDGTPANLRKLQTLFDRAERGDDLVPIVDELQAMHGKMSTALREFEHGLGARAKRGDAPLLADFAAAFHTHLDGLLEGLSRMLEGARDANLDAMRQGLDAALASGREMHAAQQELQSGMGVHAPAQ